MEQIAPPNSVGMRFTTVYGPGARETMLIPRILRNDVPYINVNHKRDFIHVDEVISAILLLLHNSYKGIIYGKILFNSIPKHIYKSKLKQHFFGIEIKSEKPTFDKEKIILMDFQQKKNIVHFFYLLPFSEKEH